MINKQNKKQEKTDHSQKPKTVDLYSDEDPLNSPLHKWKVTSYLDKRGRLKNRITIKRKTDDELWDTPNKKIVNDETIAKRISSKPPIFDKVKHKLIIGNETLNIPLDTIEYCLYKIMFSKGKEIPISWDLIADEYDGPEFTGAKHLKLRSIYDAVRRANERVESKFHIKKLFQWEEKSVKRLI